MTFIGPHSKFTSHGLTFLRGEPRPVPAEVAAALAGHPWFEMDAEEAVPAETPKRRGRPRKANGNGQ